MQVEHPLDHIFCCTPSAAKDSPIQQKQSIYIYSALQALHLAISSSLYIRQKIATYVSPSKLSLEQQRHRCFASVIFAPRRPRRWGRCRICRRIPTLPSSSRHRGRSESWLGGVGRFGVEVGQGFEKWVKVAHVAGVLHSACHATSRSGDG